MKKSTKRWGLTALIVVLIGGFFLLDLQPSIVSYPIAVQPSAEALRIHQDAIVIDLHVDSLIWPRDLTLEGTTGHLDFPRMRRGGLDAAAFTIPTRFFGLAGLKAFHDLRPPATWFSSWERYRTQVSSMKSFLEISGQQAAIATDPETIRNHHKKGVLSVFHGIEGAHALGEDLTRVRQVAMDGVVFVGIVHLWKNEYGGSSFGFDGGLTHLGRRLIDQMNEVGLMVDLAHAGPKTFEAALAQTRLPPIVSHAGARAVHDTWRNLSDDQIQAVAQRGGVIGVMLVPPALDRPDLFEALEHLAHIVEVGGEDVAALGSDFDGYMKSPIDASGLAQLTELMLRAGWSASRIRKILGENVLRVMGEAKQAGSTPTY